MLLNRTIINQMLKSRQKTFLAINFERCVIEDCQQFKKKETMQSTGFHAQCMFILRFVLGKLSKWSKLVLHDIILCFRFLFVQHRAK